MIKKSWWRLVSLAFLFSGGASVLVFAQQQSSHDSAPLDTKNLVVQLCDGKTNVVAPGVKPGERLAPEQARAVSDKLMSLWKAGQPAETASRWEREGKRVFRLGSEA